MEDIKTRLFRGVSQSWIQFFSDTTISNEINYVLGAVNWNDVIPSVENVLNVFRFTEPEEIKVIIIGQDPYPNAAHATGLAFGVSGTIPISGIPGSLINVFKCLKRDYPNTRIEHGDLRQWALKGIFLLNTSLTFKGKTTINLWQGFVTGVIRKLYTTNRNIVFVAWGTKAQTILQEIPKCICVQGIHPSNTTGRTSEFIEAQHFLNINAELKRLGMAEIDFSLY